jgi:uncharacterized cysteine cluster protein YcgN (CxxCxxCC family)
MKRRKVDERPFWERKALTEMTAAEWESLCDGCGRCCLLKLADEDGSNVVYTDVACRLLDLESCRCGDYPRRHRLVKDCVRLTPENLGQLGWMPSTCAYRLLYEGKPLYWWHPLVSGDPATVRAAGIAVAGRVVSERKVPEEELEDHIVEWPV